MLMAEQSPDDMFALLKIPDMLTAELSIYDMFCFKVFKFQTMKK